MMILSIIMFVGVGHKLKYVLFERVSFSALWTDAIMSITKQRVGEFIPKKKKKTIILINIQALAQ